MALYQQCKYSSTKLLLNFSEPSCASRYRISLFPKAIWNKFTLKWVEKNKCFRRTLQTVESREFIKFCIVTQILFSYSYYMNHIRSSIHAYYFREYISGKFQKFIFHRPKFWESQDVPDLQHPFKLKEEHYSQRIKVICSLLLMRHKLNLLFWKCVDDCKYLL